MCTGSSGTVLAALEWNPHHLNCEASSGASTLCFCHPRSAGPFRLERVRGAAGVLQPLLLPVPAHFFLEALKDQRAPIITSF